MTARSSDLFPVREGMMRALRAFFQALRLTLRGETLTVPDYQPLLDWMAETIQQVDAVYAAAEEAGMNAEARTAFRFMVDGRDISMEVVLATVRHHASAEYPYLLRHRIAHNLTALYASNMNDHYRVSRLGQAKNLPDNAGLTQGIQRLADHLEAVSQADSAQ